MLIAIGLGSVRPVSAASIDLSMEARCQHVTAGEPILFHGRVLIETPDITAPELRLANSLLSARCGQTSTTLLDRYVHLHPTDYHAAFLQARLAWTGTTSGDLEQILSDVLKDHPDFTSAQVLRASLLISQNQNHDAQTLLSVLSLRAPTDLWVFLDELQLEAKRSPSDSLRATLLEINKDPRFPPSARETASWVGRYLPNLTRDQHEAFYWADLQYESSTPMPCKLFNIAFLLSEADGRFDQTRTLLEAPDALSGDCFGVVSNRVLLAQAYLMEAAKINAIPSPANAPLVARASDVLGGDFSPLTRHVTGRPQYSTLKPFLASTTRPSDRDEYGITQLCHAIMLSDVDAIRAQLDQGADPNGPCGDQGRSLIGYIIMSAPGSGTTDKRHDIVGLLRSAGAQPTAQEIESCKNPDNGHFCADVLLPILTR